MKIPKLNPKKILIIMVVLFIVGYTAFQAKNLITGSVIDIQYPKNGETVYSPVIDVRGVAKNISYINMDDRPIFVDESGNFSEKLILSVGYNIITIKAKDRFGRSTEKILEVVLDNKGS